MSEGQGRADRQPPRTAAVILAAGAGRRFGGPKQLASIDGRPMLERVVEVTNVVAELDPVMVVLGAYAPLVRAQIRFGRARTCVCPNWVDGISASIRFGVEQSDGADAVLFLLGDQPGMSPAAIEKVLRSVRPSDSAVRASYEGEPGHPVLVRRPLFSSLGELRGDTGARSVLESAGVSLIECSGLADPTDVDRPLAGPSVVPRYSPS